MIYDFYEKSLKKVMSITCIILFNTTIFATANAVRVDF